MFVYVFLGVLLFGIFYTFILPTETYQVQVGNVTEVSKSAEIGVVNGVEIWDDKIRIEYKEGTWGMGWDVIKKRIFETNKTIIPSDVIKITKTKMMGTDCSFYRDGVNTTDRSLPFKGRYEGDLCGTYYIYDVEKIKSNGD